MHAPILIDALSASVPLSVVPFDGRHRVPALGFSGPFFTSPFVCIFMCVRESVYVQGFLLYRIVSSGQCAQHVPRIRATPLFFSASQNKTTDKKNEKILQTY